MASDVAGTRDAVEALRQVASACAEQATRSNHRRFIVTLMVETLATNARIAGEFRKMMKRFRAFLAGLVRQGQRDGKFRREVDPELAAGIFAGGVMGLEIQYYQDPGAFGLETALERFVDHYVEGLVEKPGRGVRGDRHGRLRTE
ncbi:MAG: hypothetical protein KatS3mg076_1369 [Candidatus Binatia bacterium]|nr:MAG: hypothetical protein KatS3mg076_1369 [Candidatus Binatia bacterium]